MKRYEKHLFVCENKRPEGHPKGCCAEKKAKEITQLLKKRLAELELTKNIRVNISGCLGACQFGPSIVVYPEQIWYGNVKAADVEEIIQSHLVNNIPVERLIIQDKNYHKDV